MNGRPVLLDMFCKAGGAGTGYYRAGFNVVGVDIEPQPRYPFDFVQADALEYALQHGSAFDAFHASPPCQKYSKMRRGRWQERNHPDLVVPTRNVLKRIGKPFVIENVVGAPLENPIMLCGTMFGLQTSDGSQLRRHRLFETSWLFKRTVPQCNHRPGALSIPMYGHTGGRSKRDGYDFTAFTVAARREAMGIDWMTAAELAQAIPPAYTLFVGLELLEQI